MISTLSRKFVFFFASTHYLANVYLLGNLSVNKFLGALAISIWLIKKAGDLVILRKNYSTRSDMQIFLILICFIIIHIIGLIFSVNVIESLNSRTVPIIMNIIVFFMLSDVIRNEKDLDNCIKVLAFSTVIYAIINLLIWLQVIELQLLSTSSIKHVGSMKRMIGLQQNPNYNAFMFLPILPFFFQRLITTKQPKNFFLILAVFILVLFNIFITYSRNIILVSTTILIFMIFKQRSTVGKKTLIMVIAFLLLGTTFMVIPGLSERLLTVTKISQISADPGQYIGVKGESSIGIRLSILQKGIEVFLDNPLLGVGAGNFQEVSDISYGDRTLNPSAHNSYLEIAAEHGFLGILLFCLVLYLINKRFKEIKFFGTYVALKASFFSLVMSLFFITAHQQRLFWIILALSVAAIRIYGKPQRGHGVSAMAYKRS